MSTTKEQYLKRIIQSISRLQQTEGCFESKIAQSKANLEEQLSRWQNQKRIQTQDAQSRVKAGV